MAATVAEEAYSSGVDSVRKVIDKAVKISN
jgi:hypothetical protein